MTLASRSNQVTVVCAGTQETVTLDAPVYIDPYSWRTYVPVSFMEEVVGCRTGYDEAKKTVIIANLDELTARAMEGLEFNYLNAHLGYGEQHNEGIWNVDLTVDGFSTVAGKKLLLSGKLSGTIADSSKIQMQVEMLATTGMKNELRTNLSTGNSYIQADGALAPVSWEGAEDITGMFFSKTDFDHGEDWGTVLECMRGLYSGLSDDKFVRDGNTCTAEFQPPAQTGIDLGRRSVTIEDGKVTGYAVYFDCTFTVPQTGKTVHLVLDKTVAGGTENNRYTIERDGVLTRDLTRTLPPAPPRPRPLPMRALRAAK